MKKTSKVFKTIAFTLLAACIAATLTVIAANIATSKKTDKYIYNSTDSIPQCKAALVPGCAQYLSGGRLNPFFQYRIDAAAKLYFSGKIKYIVVSGDNSTTTYNEPKAMKEALVREGIPADVIFLDYAGLRTLDSVIRMREIFSQDRYIVVSQRFQNERAIFIARHYGMEVYGFDAQDVTGRFSLKTHIREKFARVRMFLDILTDKQPKFLGEKVDIENGKPNDIES